MLKKIKSNYLLKLLAYSFKEFPLLYFAFTLSIGSVFIELLAMSALMPLAIFSSPSTSGLSKKLKPFL